MGNVQEQTVFPGGDWEEATPESQGVDSEKLKAAVAFMEENFGADGAKELVIIRNGYLIWAGPDSDIYHEIYSATKTFTSTVLGLMLDDGKCSLETRAVEYLPELADIDPAYAQLKLRDLATMTGGYHGTVANITEGQRWGDPIVYVTQPEPPLHAPPGSQVDYNDHDVHLLGRLLAMHIAKEPLKDVLKRRLADPIGLTQWDWGISGTIEGKTHYNAAGTPALNGNGGIQITPRELARYGYLFLNQGAWKGQQLLSPSTIAALTSTQVPATLPGRCSSWLSGAYGCYWYTNGVMAKGQRRWPAAPPGAYTASGGGGNICLVIPEWNMVVARMGKSEIGSMSLDSPMNGFLTRLGDALVSNSIRSTAVPRKTEVSIRGEAFYINGRPTYEGRTYQGLKIEGLLMNSRMVQATFDDLRAETRAQWSYPDTGEWDPQRNTEEFLAAMPEWREHGLLAVTLNLQGGFPRGDVADLPCAAKVETTDTTWWHNSAFTKTGELRADYMERLERILDRADELGMVVILGLFYFGQDQIFENEEAILRGLDNAMNWLLDRDYRNVMIEISNESDVTYYRHKILTKGRVHELIARAQSHQREGRRLLVSTSFGGGSIPDAETARVGDFILLHGNNVEDPNIIAEMVRKTRALATYRPVPILFNEDDHFNFETPRNNFLAAVGEYASWGYFDHGKNNYCDGYQTPPVQWGINTEEKRGFFRLLRRMTGADILVNEVEGSEVFAGVS